MLQKNCVKWIKTVTYKCLLSDFTTGTCRKSHIHDQLTKYIFPWFTASIKVQCAGEAKLILVTLVRHPLGYGRRGEYFK